MTTEIVGEFEWDTAKARENVRKHGGRLILVGMTLPERLLYVVYTERTHSGRLRIISARRATRHEQKNYEDG